MKKYLFAAAALPFALASCTQDAVESEITPGTPNAKGFKLELVAQKGDAATRGFIYDVADDEDPGMKFTGTDQINMFWLGTDAPIDIKNYYQNFNSIFNIESQNGEDTKFLSKSLVYAGYNVATFPGDHTTKAEDITLTVSNVPDGIVNIPFISNLLDLKATGESSMSGNLQNGYGNKLSLPMKQAANYAQVDLAFDHIATNIKGYEGGMEVEKIEFKAGSEKVFAEMAGIQSTDGEVTTNGSFKIGNTSYEPIVKQARAVAMENSRTAELSSTAVRVDNNGNTKAETTGKAFVMTFPTQEYQGEKFAAGEQITEGSIVVTTNMGYITIKTDVEGEGEAQKNNTPLFNEGKPVTVEDFLNLLTTYRVSTQTGSYFKGEIVGKRIHRTLNVDMRKAVISGSVVYNSDDIIRYINLYNGLEKKDDLILKLSNENNKPFAGLNAEALKMLNTNNKFRLDLNGNASVKLLGGGKVQDMTPAAAKFENTPATVNFELEAGQAWTMEQDMDAKEGSRTYTYTNAGTLALVKGDATKDALGYALTNNGTVNVSETDFALGQYTADTNSTTNVATGKILTFKGAVTVLKGTVNVDANAQMMAAGSAEVTNTGTINNSGFIAVQIGGNGSITNIGTINIKNDASTTLVTNNAQGTNNGTINLNKRDNEVSVGEENKQGYIAIKTTLLEDSHSYKYKDGDKMNTLNVNGGDINIDNSSDKISDINIESASKVTGIFTISGKLTVKTQHTMTIPTENSVTVGTETIIEKSAKIIVGGTLHYKQCENTTQIYTTGSSASVGE